MLRIVVLRALLLLVPFALYATYLVVVKRQKAHHGQNWSEAPWTWLIGSGLALMIASFMVLRFFPDGDRIYMPPAPVIGDEAPLTGPVQ